MKIVLFNLHYSPNTGDGVIADCLIHAITAERPDAQVVSVDLSGRTGFGAVTVRNRALAMKVLAALPRVLRQPLALNRLDALLDRAEPRWRAALDGADAALIGGGQLFSDADLNFPAKIGRAAALLAQARIPVAIHGVGVARNWSPRGTALFNRVFETDLRSVGVRDAASATAWSEQAARALPAPRLTRDPGLLAAAAYGPPTEEAAHTALCITDPAILAYHAEAGVAGKGGAVFFEALALALAAQPGGVRLFCNGAAEDAAALTRLAARPAIARAAAEGRLSVAPVPATPAELAAIIAPAAAVVAHRLHACILGYAYARPVVGLGWDAKVASFFDSVGLSRFFVPPDGAGAATAAALAAEARATGLDPTTHARVLSETRAQVRDTLASLGLTDT